MKSYKMSLAIMKLLWVGCEISLKNFCIEDLISNAAIRRGRSLGGDWIIRVLTSSGY
jgi:hypothetical protein